MCQMTALCPITASHAASIPAYDVMSSTGSHHQPGSVHADLSATVPCICFSHSSCGADVYLDVSSWHVRNFPGISQLTRLHVLNAFHCPALIRSSILLSFMSLRGAATFEGPADELALPQSVLLLVSGKVSI